VIADSENFRVRRVAPDGVIGTIAGSREDFGDRPERNGDGGPATSADVGPSALAIAADGALLIAESFTGDVRRVGADGVISTVAGNGDEGPTPRDRTLATEVPLDPQAIAATPDGGFLVGNKAGNSCVGGEPAVLRVAPDGRVTRVAGTGRFIEDPPLGDERAGDGGPALHADLRGIEGLAVTPDGGVLVVDSTVACSDAVTPALVRYVAPQAPALFAASFLDAQSRVFARGATADLSVALTLPGTVTVAVGSAGSAPQELPAGASTVSLPAPMGAKPVTVTLTATGAAGAEAHDSLQLFPAGWLPLARASIDAEKLAFNVPRLHEGFTGASAILGCRRLGPARVDCRMTENRKRCDGVISVMLRGGKLAWGEYRCPLRKKPAWRSRPRVLKRRHLACVEDPWCDKHPLALPFGWGPDRVIAYKGIGL
jgi:hypothetical protein